MRTTTPVYYVIRLSGKTRQAGAPKNRQRFLSIRPGFPRDGVERRSTVSNLSPAGNKLYHPTAPLRIRFRRGNTRNN